MAGDIPYDDERWDEDRWEAFLRDHDRRVDRFVELIYRFLSTHPRPDPAEAAAFEAWKRTLRAFLQDQGWQREDRSLPFVWLYDEATPGEGGEEEALFGSGDALFYDDDALGAAEDLPLYQRAHRLSTDVLDWAHALSADVKDNALVHFCSHITQVPAHLAEGHRLACERGAIGGNIACVKRSLADANAALALLRRIKQAPYMDAALYPPLYEHLFELRNDLGLYVQELRDQFNLGIG